MTGFDAVLIGAIGGVVCVFIGLIANRNGDNSKSKQWGTAFAVGIGEQYYIINQSIPEGCNVPAGTKVLLELSSKKP